MQRLSRSIGGLAACIVVALLAPSAVLADCVDPPGSGVDWTRCYFDERTFQDVDLSGARLNDATFSRGDLSGADLSKVHAARAKFIHTTLVEVNFEGAYCLVATGRRPYTDNLGLENAGVQKDDRGRIEVDDHLQTNVPGIYAIGDVVKGAMLAHKASEEGVFVAEVIAGQHPHINYRAIPNVVYTWPEVAGVGFTEEELKANGTPYKSGTFHFRASGRARASMDTDGLVKILSHKETDEMLGMHIIGPRAADMIMEGVMGVEFRASAEDLAIFSHAHPTFSESIKEAAMDATGARAIHK